MAESPCGNPSHNRQLGALITAISLVAIALLTLLPARQHATTVPMFCLACGPLGGVDLILNVVLFVPLGIGLRLQTGSARTAIAVGLLITLTVELLQWRVVSGRDASLGDIIANGAGSALGAWIGGQLRSWWMMVGQPAARAGMQYAILASVTILVLAALLQPGRSSDPYAVQWTRVLENADAFGGTLNWAVVNSKRLKPAELLRTIKSPDGERSRLTVSVGVSGMIGPTRRRAEILRLGNPRSEAMLLGQRGNAVVFRAFTRAERLRLRSPLVSLPLVLSAGGSTDDSGEVIISARSTAREVGLSITKGADTVGVSVPRTLGLSWSLFAPWEVPVGPRWWPANAATLALLVLPASFLASRARHASQVAGRMTSAGAVLTVLVAIAAAPSATGLSQATLLEWGGVLAGLVAGHALARLPLERAVDA